MSSAVKKVHTPEHPTHGSADAKSEQEYNRRILVVEDEPAIAEGIKNILSPPANVIPLRSSSRSTTPEPYKMPEGSRFEVVWAKTPDEALNLVKDSMSENKPFAIGFFDVLLGSNIDGIELLRLIHLMDQEIFAVFVTAYHDRSVDQINQVLGPERSDRWDYMNKPFTDGEILQKARNAVSWWNLRRQKAQQDYRLNEAQRKLLQGERASTLAAVGRSIAHEFGNMMMQIVGNAEMAIMKKDQFRMEEALKNIIKAADMATKMLGKFKKAQGDNLSDRHIPISINQALDEAVDLMAHEFTKHNIKVTKVKTEPCILPASHPELVQVFVNVFINATHVMPKSGQIDLSITKPKPDLVEVRIHDYGPGIPAEILPRVTEPMFTTKGSEGTGLGLAICKEIVEIGHHGELLVTNHPSKGVEIIIRLPKVDD